jgi:hypothetical protein
VTLVRGRRDGFVDVVLGATKPYLVISEEHLVKMRRLSELHEADRVSEDEGDAQGDGATNGFNHSLYCALMRYETLRGAGYQCAVPRLAFEALVPHLGRVVEMFASPLNSHGARFCSAFGPLETAFGSLGSFFELDPESGTFEANPPFVPEIMDAMVARIAELLSDASRGPLSYLVVVPSWGAGVKTLKMLLGSRCAEWRRASITIPAAEHVFVDGAQHTKGGQDQYRPSSWDTSVVLLQNDLGATKWSRSSSTSIRTRAC